MNVFMMIIILCVCVCVCSVEYWFRCMDLDGDGVLSMYELEYFYEEQCERMEGMGIEPLPFQDLLCQMLDLVKPESQGQWMGQRSKVFPCNRQPVWCNELQFQWRVTCKFKYIPNCSKMIRHQIHLIICIKLLYIRISITLWKATLTRNILKLTLENETLIVTLLKETLESNTL